MNAHNFFASLLMALAITHSTPSDASFSASGAAAWDASHTVTGLAAVATSGAYTDLSGTPTIITLSQVWPVGSIYIETAGVNPSTTFGMGTWTLYAKGKTLIGFSTGDPDFGTAGATGGATGIAYTPSGTIDMTLYIPKGTNSSASFTPSGTLAWPASVPLFAGTTATTTASVNWPAGVPTINHGVQTATASVNWPTATPSASGNAHRHDLPIIHTDNSVVRFLPTSKFGISSVTGVEDVKLTVTNVLVVEASVSAFVMLSNTATATVSVVWPASVPQAVVSVTPTGTVSWPASVPQAVASVSPAGIITWPTGTPSFTGTAGTVPAQTFTGAAGSGSAIFTGVAAALDKLPPFIVTYMWQRTA